MSYHDALDQPLSDGVRNFGAPFDAADADIILRSANQVDFRAHRANLVVSSPFFKAMLALPVPAQGALSADERKDGLTVILMSEDTRTVELLLLLSYPAHFPAMPANITMMYPVIQLSQKFEMPMADIFARSSLLALAPTEPERVYALGWLLRSKAVITAATKESLVRPLAQSAGPLPHPEYACVPATAFLHLLAYQQRCLLRLSTVGSDLEWISYRSLPSGMREGDENGQCYCDNETGVRLLEGNFLVKDWWTPYLVTAQIELQKSCCTSSVKGFNSLRGLIAHGISDCQNCRHAAVPALEELSELLTDYVESILMEELPELYASLPF